MYMQTKNVVEGMKLVIADVVIALCQTMAYFVLFFVVRGIFRVKKHVPANISLLRRGCLLIANHQSRWDAGVAVLNLPFPVFLKVIPVRFPTHHDYMGHPLWGKFPPLLGCYDVGVDNRAKMLTLYRTRHFLQSGRTIFLFPEGGIANTENMKVFKQGIEFFLKETDSAIFVRLKGFNGNTFKTWFTRRKSVTYGEVRGTATIPVTANEIQQHFYFLADNRSMEQF
jgi:hypothetical protein